MNQSDAAVRELVSTQELEASVAHLCSLGEKVSGSEEERKACDFITSRLKAYGYTPTVHTFESYISYPRSAKLSIHAGGKTIVIPAVGVAFGLSTGPDGITEDVVFVGAGNESDYVGKDVRRQDRARQQAALAEQRGRGGGARRARHDLHVGRQAAPQDDHHAGLGHAGVRSGEKHPARPRGVDRQDRRRSGRRAAESRPGARHAVRRHLRGLAHGAPAGLRACRARSREFVLVGAHYCSWFDGSTDNVTGDSCVLELARILKQFDGKLRYGIRFAWWPGHSHGRYSGSTWYADTFWHDLRDHAIAYFNIDSPGVRGATVYVPRHQMAEVSEFNEMMTTEVTGWATIKSSNAQLALGKRSDKYVSPTRPSRAADQSFWGIGVSSMSVYSMLTPDDADRDHNVGGSGGAWWWHSEHETIDKFDSAILAQDTHLYAAIMLRLAHRRDPALQSRRHRAGLSRQPEGIRRGSRPVAAVEGR